MRTLSLAQASVYATGAFVGVLALFAGAAAIAIGGPLTKYEASGLGEGASDAVHDVRGAMHRLRGGVCRRLPVALRDMAPCPKVSVASKTHGGARTATHTHASTAASSHASGAHTSVSRALSTPRHALRRVTPHRKPPHHR